jgi:hypothetical protein
LPSTASNALIRRSRIASRRGVELELSKEA